MDTGRSRRSIAFILLVGLFVLGRIITSSNPIYTLLEPVVQAMSSLVRPVLIADPRYVDAPEGLSQFELQRLEQENAQLRTQLDQPATDQAHLRANVTLRNLHGFNKTLWLDKGSRHMVRVGDVVLSEQTLIGRVIEVYDRSAAVQVITDPEFTMTVKTNKDLHGLLRVDHGSVIVDLLPSKEQTGQLITSDGLDGFTPADYVVGRLAQEFGQTSDVFGTYHVELPYNPNDITQVEIRLTGGDDT